MQTIHTFKIALIGLLIIFAVTESALAHRYIQNDGSHTTPESAIVIDDVEISYAVYDELETADNQLWIGFYATEGQRFFAELGIPANEDLNFHPTFAVIGPGLGDDPLPFDLSVEGGVRLFEVDPASEPRFFHEEFSDTDNWILTTADFVLPETGTYYIVVYSESGQTGKYWIAPGKREVFGIGDVAKMPGWIAEVRQFYGLSDRVGWMETLRYLALGGLMLAAIMIYAVIRK